MLLKKVEKLADGRTAISFLADVQSNFLVSLKIWGLLDIIIILISAFLKINKPILLTKLTTF